MEHRKRIILTSVLLAGISLDFFHRSMTGIMEREISEIAGVLDGDSRVLLSLASSLFFYAYGFSQFFLGSLLDSFGISRVTTLLLLVMGFGTLLMATGSPVLLLASRVVVGFSAAVLFLSYQRALSLYYRRDEQAWATAIGLMIGSLSALLATYPLRLFLERFGFVYTVIVLSTITIIVAVLLWLTSRIGLRDNGSNGSILVTLRNLGLIAKDPHSWSVSIGTLATYGVVLSFQSSWGQLLLSDYHGLDRIVVSYYLMLLATLFLVSSLLAGYISDKIIQKRKPILILSHVFIAVAWILLYIIHQFRNNYLLPISIIIMGVGVGLHVVAPPMIREVYGVEVAATSIAFANIVLFIGIALLNTILPLVDPSTAVLASLIITTVSTIIVAKYARETLKQ